MRIITLILVLAVLPAWGFSKTIYVPDDEPTIQFAIYNSSHGDTVIVRPDSVNGGPYLENIDFVGMAITVKSELGPSVTTIDGGKAGSVASFKSFEEANSVLDGFTLTNGTGMYLGTGFNGGGIYCYQSSPTIMNCSIVDCSVDEMGGGIYCEECAPIIVDNTFIGNTSWSGAGIYCTDSAPSIEDNYFYKNTGLHSGGGVGCYQSAPRILNNIMEENTGCWGAGIMLTYSNALISNNLIVWNASPTGYWSSGGGIHCEASAPFIINNTIAYNKVEHYGGGLCCGTNSEVVAKNNILWNNQASYGPEIGLLDTTYPSHLDIDFSDVEGGHGQLYIEAGCSVDWGLYMIDADPQFHYGPSGAFYLGQEPCQPGLYNPCVDSGCDLAINLCMDTCWTRTDESIDTGVADMGFHYGPHVPPTLHVNAFVVSQSTGGVVDFEMTAGFDNGNRHYLLLGSVTGTSPGTVLPGGMVLPVNWDAFTGLCLQLVNTPVFLDFMGALDTAGIGKAQLNAPPLPPASIGLAMYFAACLNNPFDFTTNPVEIDIVP